MDGIRKKIPRPTAYETPQEPEQTAPIFYDFASTYENHPENAPIKKNANNILKKLVISFFFFLFCASIAYGIFFFWNVYSASNKITTDTKTQSFASEIKSAALSFIPSHRKTLSGEERGRVNILLLGAAGEKKPGNNLTDTVMLASIDTQSKKIALLSIPRDLYVKIPASAADGPASTSYAKINSLYQIGLKSGDGADLVKKSVTEVTGQKIDYYLAVDFDGFTKFIDMLGGITINVEKDIYDTRYPGPNYSYETFALNKGVQKLDGATALKYVRERHSDSEGDFGRAKRQQQTLQAVKNKVFSIGTLLNISTLNGLLATLEENVRTDMSLSEMESFLFLLKEADTQNISTKVLDAWKSDSLLKVSHIFFGETRAFALVPKVGSYSQVYELAENIFDIEKIQRRKKEFSKEEAAITLINESGDGTLSEKVRRVLSDSLGVKPYLIKMATGEKIRQKTEVIDNTDGQKIFTLDEIVKTTPASLSQKSETESSIASDFELYLGKDLIEIYRYEEVSKEEYEKGQEKEFEF